MSTLQLLWFLIIGVLFTGFFFLEGFDFGVGMAMKTLARNKRERDQVINTIGPIWETNQVWLITAGEQCLLHSQNGTHHYLVVFIIFYYLF